MEDKREQIAYTKVGSDKRVVTTAYRNYNGRAWPSDTLKLECQYKHKDTGKWTDLRSIPDWARHIVVQHVIAGNITLDQWKIQDNKEYFEKRGPLNEPEQAAFDVATTPKPSTFEDDDIPF